MEGKHRLELHKYKKYFSIALQLHKYRFSPSQREHLTSDHLLSRVRDENQTVTVFTSRKLFCSHLNNFFPRQKQNCNYILFFVKMSN